jgi:hypothetical protein
VCCFFYGHVVAVEEAPDGARREADAVFGAQHLGKLDKALLR